MLFRDSVGCSKIAQRNWSTSIIAYAELQKGGDGCPIDETVNILNIPETKVFTLEHDDERCVVNKLQQDPREDTSAIPFRWIGLHL